MPTTERFPMEDDRVVGDGGNLTIYERPDSSRYALDKRGHGREYEPEGPVFGRARFDARAASSGSWKGSRSIPQRPEAATPDFGPGRRMRRRSWSR